MMTQEIVFPLFKVVASLFVRFSNMSGNLVCMIVTRSKEAEKVWSTKTNPIITVSTTSVLHMTLAADPMLVTEKKRIYFQQNQAGSKKSESRQHWFWNKTTMYMHAKIHRYLKDFLPKAFSTSYYVLFMFSAVWTMYLYLTCHFIFRSISALSCLDNERKRPPLFAADFFSHVGR